MSDYDKVSSVAAQLRCWLQALLGRSLVSVGVIRAPGSDDFKILINLADHSAEKRLPAFGDSIVTDAGRLFAIGPRDFELITKVPESEEDTENIDIETRVTGPARAHSTF